MLIGLGCGQQDRIACVRLCLERSTRAGHNATGSVFASDGFFPYAESKTKTLSRKDKENIINSLKATAKSLNKVSEKKQALKYLSKITDSVSKLDRREGTELLADAGCIGGVVPADGKELENVKNFFKKSGLSVGFIAPENRGFAKH